MGLDQYIIPYKNGKQDEDSEIYFRKAYWLRNWMIENTLFTGTSCNEFEVELQTIIKLHEACGNVLKNKENAGDVFDNEWAGYDDYFFAQVTDAYEGTYYFMTNWSYWDIKKWDKIVYYEC